ncbi:hypothetical protein [Sphingobacterium multivorum]|uniref:hypothetical protein n=1 Tax=Sphingobacterium multivorum TaxID=28454 RepID=UPI0028AF6892|nr:hypothetical protein [Sphingobacterium multivorum]
MIQVLKRWRRHKYRLLDPQGNMLMDESQRDEDPVFGDEHFRPEIDRGALRDLIDGLLPGGVSNVNSKILSVQ